MSTGYLYDFLLKTISDEYGSSLISINNKIIQTQIQSVNVINDGKKCNSCLSLFIDNPHNPNNSKEITKMIDVLRGVNYYKKCNTKNDCNIGVCNKQDKCLVSYDGENECVRFNKDAICYSSCTDELCGLNLENTMNFNVENFQNPSKEDVLNISKQINNKIQKEYNDNNYNATNDINNVVNILTTINFSQIISTSQVATQIQAVNITGSSVKLTSVKMSIVSDIIMKAIIKNTESIDIITKISNELIEKIKDDVKHDFLSNFEYAWKSLKKFVIITGIVFISIIIGIVILLISNAMKR